ncbi:MULTISPECIES: MBL fold metallo-hydrolase [unclassified Sphingomonas]|uniref:MBL fold metallo-hydrolase n=1 Tax=unclassified Sphingomonas TaxID=196159 RepID=UPI0006F3EAC4|nr:MULTISPECIES: MBL fold metallo-hydrolase [unclassified Sphingomonas]KQX25100.1 MBL fold metallo-hydrolase [Sphingomonas sp. Root1294]KQY66117.1 MBL fold metallo-hydrolase [Sphingomonas sp. Root50]KRB89717.1 MBL fold metallo-hydrolase [Sphingomonas sp. Root720]
MAGISEIADGIFRIVIFSSKFNLSFSHFLIRDEQPMLFHAGLRGMFAELHEAVATVIDPASLRFIGFSHFESDECGALNDWLAVAPAAVPLCGPVGAMTSVSDFATRPPHILGDRDRLDTGRRRFRLIATPHLPHGWDAGMLFDESERILFCSDLLSQGGDCPPIGDGDAVGRATPNLLKSTSGPFAHSTAYSPRTGAMLEELAQLEPATLALMHGSSVSGNGAAILRDLSAAMEGILGAGTGDAGGPDRA